MVLTGPAASLLATAAFGAVAPAGAIAVPELQRLRSPLEEEQGRAHAHSHVFSLFAAEGNTLIAASRRPLPPEQAQTWAMTVAAAVGPAAIVVACSMLAMEYRGPGDPSEEALVFELHSTAAAAPPGVPPLPPSSLLTGLPAALLEHGEAAGRPVTAIVAVESAPVPDAAVVGALADAVCGAAGRPALGAAGRAAVAAQVDAIYRASASNSMFI